MKLERSVEAKKPKDTKNPDDRRKFRERVLSVGEKLSYTSKEKRRIGGEKRYGEGEIITVLPEKREVPIAAFIKKLMRGHWRNNSIHLANLSIHQRAENPKDGLR